VVVQGSAKAEGNGGKRGLVKSDRQSKVNL